MFFQNTIIKKYIALLNEDLLRFRNFGKKSLEELDNFLADHHLSWGMEID